MVAVTIRDVPDDVRNVLAARAARSGRSLQEYLAAHLRDLAAQPTVDEVLERARERVRATGTHVPVADLLAARDAERR